MGASGTSPSRLEGKTGGAVVSARYVLSFGWLDLGFGPYVEALLRPIVVDLSRVEVFRVPSVVAGVSIDGAFRSLRSGS